MRGGYYGDWWRPAGRRFDATASEALSSRGFRATLFLK